MRFTHFVPDDDTDAMIKLNHPTQLHLHTFWIQAHLTELAYVQTDNVFDSHVRRNIPKGALVGLQAELNRTRTQGGASSSSSFSIHNTTPWERIVLRQPILTVFF